VISSRDPLGGQSVFTLIVVVTAAGIDLHLIVDIKKLVALVVEGFVVATKDRAKDALAFAQSCSSFVKVLDQLAND
jgi:hypothetical protein